MLLCSSDDGRALARPAEVLFASLKWRNIPSFFSFLNGKTQWLQCLGSLVPLPWKNLSFAAMHGPAINPKPGEKAAGALRGEQGSVPGGRQCWGCENRDVKKCNFQHTRTQNQELRALFKYKTPNFQCFFISEGLCIEVFAP